MRAFINILEQELMSDGWEFIGFNEMRNSIIITVGATNEEEGGIYAVLDLIDLVSYSELGEHLFADVVNKTLDSLGGEGMYDWYNYEIEIDKPY